MAEHTPLPWESTGPSDVWPYANRGLGDIFGAWENDHKIRHQVATMVRPGDAEFIVRAVNAHDELLAALEALTEWGRTHTSPLDTNSPHDLLIAAVNAIAKAKGG